MGWLKVWFILRKKFFSICEPVKSDKLYASKIQVRRTFSFQKRERRKESQASPKPSKADSIIFFFLIYLFWLHWVFVAACRLSLAVVSRGYSLFWCTDSKPTGFSRYGSQALEHGLSSCGPGTLLPRDMGNLPRPGIEPMCPCTGRWILIHCITREVPTRS